MVIQQHQDPKAAIGASEGLRGLARLKLNNIMVIQQHQDPKAAIEASEGLRGTRKAKT